jgi:hypothetical protein
MPYSFLHPPFFHGRLVGCARGYGLVGLRELSDFGLRLFDPRAMAEKLHENGSGYSRSMQTICSETGNSIRPGFVEVLFSVDVRPIQFCGLCFPGVSRYAMR